MGLTLGPDASRYWLLAGGDRVGRPFHLRRLLPWALGQNLSAWWLVWGLSWPVLAGGMFAWQMSAGVGWQTATAAVVLLAALPGILGPSSVIPVGVDLPATALAVWSVAMLEAGGPFRAAGAVLVILVAAGVKESAPVWAALWAWSPLLLIGCVVPLIVHLVRRPGPDPLGPKFQFIADHPVRAALAAHRGRWRDGWLLVAPWGVCLAALIGADWRLIVVVVVAHLQLLVATDTVRLVQHAAGPAVAAAAASNVPVSWLLAACVVHVVWWRRPERV